MTAKGERNMNKNQREVLDTLRNYLTTHEAPRSLLHGSFISFEDNFEEADFILFQDINEQFKNGNIGDGIGIAWAFFDKCMGGMKQNENILNMQAYMCKCISEGRSVKDVYVIDGVFLVCNTCHHLLGNIPVSMAMRISR